MSCCRPETTGDRDRAAMCFACVGREPVCCMTREPVVLHIHGKPCPLNRHPVDGIVQWRDIEWYGVPAPIRWWIFLRAGHKPSRYAGCGCVRVLKDWWTRIVKGAQGLKHGNQ